MSANMIKIALAAMVLSTALPLAACDDKDSGSQIGERIDEGVNDTKRAIEDATD
jgi:ABC-type oligopeptide transport system substrate-binding subunit